MEQWLPPNSQNSVSLIRVDGGEIWTVLSPQRRARSPSRLTTFSDANGLVYLDSLPELIMNGPHPKRRDPLADMLPADWERPEKHDLEPIKETPIQSKIKTQPATDAQTQSKTPPLTLDMPWNSASSRTKPTKTRPTQAKPKLKSRKDAGSTLPNDPDKSTDSTSPHVGSAVRRSPRISKLIALQKLQTTTLSSSPSEIEKDNRQSKLALVPVIPRKRKAARTQGTKTSEASGSDTRDNKTSGAQPSKIQRTGKASPANAEPATKDSEVARLGPTDTEVQTPAEPEEQTPLHHNRPENRSLASNQLQTPHYLEESALSYHNRVEKQESAVTGVQGPSELEETLRPPHEITQKTKTQPIYRDQAIQAFGSLTISNDEPPAEIAVASTRYEQRPSRKPAGLVHHVVDDLPKGIPKDASYLPAPKDLVPTHIAHVWDKLAKRGPQHQTHDIRQTPEPDLVPHPADRGEDHYGVDSVRSSSPLFMGQGPGYDDDQEPGAAPWPPRKIFPNGFDTYESQVSQPNPASTLHEQPSYNRLPVPASAQHFDSAYSLPHAANLTNELGGMPVQHPLSQGSASAFSEQSGETSPEEVWRRETEDESTYAIVHKIGMMLHRALKPREGVVDDIVKEYLENSVLLLKQMSTCHQTERQTTVDNHKAVTEALYSLFDTAWQDVRDLQERLQSFDISKILASTCKPGYARSSQTLNRLCDEHLSNCVEQSSRATTQDEDPAKKKGDLVEVFKSQLYEQIGHSDASTTKLQMINAEADMFIERLRNDELGFPTQKPDAQFVEDDPETISRAMGQAADGLSNSKQNRAPAGKPLPGSSQEPIEVSSHCESDSDYVD